MTLIARSFCLVFALLWLASSSAAQSARSSSKIQNGMVEVDGGKLYYEVAGKGPDLVLIHGGFGDRRMWDDQFKTFARNFRVVRYDHRGFGKSPAPQSQYSPTSDLIKLLDHLDIKRAHLVGNSMGGGLTIDMAIKHPDRVASLVVVASGPNGYPAPQEDIDKIMAVFKAASEEGVAIALKKWLEHPMVGVTMKNPNTRGRLQAMMSDNSSVFLMNYWPNEPMDPPAYKRLDEIKTPTLIIIGGQDVPLVREIGDVAAKGIAGAKKVVMDGADHLPQMVKPDEFNAIVLKFLKGL